jgi:hypothetical protein
MCISNCVCCVFVLCICPMNCVRVTTVHVYAKLCVLCFSVVCMSYELCPCHYRACACQTVCSVCFCWYDELCAFKLYVCQTVCVVCAKLYVCQTVCVVCAKLYVCATTVHTHTHRYYCKTEVHDRRRLEADARIQTSLRWLSDPKKKRGWSLRLGEVSCLFWVLFVWGGSGSG